MPDYSINYEDKRFTDVESQKQQALAENEQIYNGMIDKSNQYFQSQIDANKEWADKQQQLQQEKTDFAIEKIEQEKEQANKDYLKEQKGAYVDWQKESNQYGANAEQMAAGGLSNTGYSESSQVSMYNTYQNRVATARESYNRAVLNYNNAIKDAQLQNNSILAEIAYNALQKELELSLQGFQYENNLILDKANKKMEIDNTYYGRHQDVLNQINTENALAENARQYDENMKFQREQAERDYQLKQAQLEEERRQFNASLSSSRSSGSSGGGGGSKQYAVNTAYYQGSLNKDANTFGTFSNGYQPKGISGHGYLKKNGDTLTFETQTIYGQKQTVTQNIWKAEDGTIWYWEGRNNKYQQLVYNKKTKTYSPK